MIFGATQNKGIRLNGFTPEVVELGNGYTADDLWVHDENDFYKAQILVRMFDDPNKSGGHYPRQFGVFFQVERACYEDVMTMQIEETIATKGKGDLDKMLRGRETWEIKS
ncbi:MAG: 2-oxoglutarate ferredoxin oxidoreductase subunit beta [Chitinophagaceae bacterium]|nr:MAG: 2-oxoglutarate ferredoxin oxidoreductase subunit beta [Chitinophagaceae bacterium]